MSVEQRIRICRLIEKMHGKEEFCERLGLKDISKFRGQEIQRGEGEDHVDHTI